MNVPTGTIPTPLLLPSFTPTITNTYPTILLRDIVTWWPVQRVNALNLWANPWDTWARHQRAGEQRGVRDERYYARRLSDGNSFWKRQRTFVFLHCFICCWHLVHGGLCKSFFCLHSHNFKIPPESETSRGKAIQSEAAAVQHSFFVLAVLVKR